MYCTPGPDNSNLISTENAVPSNPENNANIKYKVPMSLALLEKNQRSHHMLMSDFVMSDFVISDDMSQTYLLKMVFTDIPFNIVIKTV